MNKNELNKWYALMKDKIKYGYLFYSDNQELIRLNHMVMEISHKIHNDHMIKHGLEDY